MMEPKALSKDSGRSSAPISFAISTNRLWRSAGVSLGLRFDGGFFAGIVALIS